VVAVDTPRANVSNVVGGKTVVEVYMDGVISSCSHARGDIDGNGLGCSDNINSVVRAQLILKVRNTSFRHGEALKILRSR